MGLFIGRSMAEERKVQLGVAVDATGAKEGFDQVKREAQSMAQSVAQAGTAAGKAVDGIGNGGKDSAAKVDSATKSMIQSIQRTTAVMEAGSRTSAKYYETLAAQRGVDVSALKPYLDQLDAVAAKQKQAEQALNATTPALNNVGMSAKATAAALRQVPAQFTDIITSLQAGQAPLTVLLQQGGQLKDTFGGIGPAARALGTYVVGLINPFTLAAGAAAALAYAYHEGNKESQAYNRALVLTGNAAGTTANQLADMAARVSAISGTQGAAAAALAELASTGKIAASNLEYFSRVALQMEKTVGQSVSETAKDLAELGKSPVEASEKLSEKYRYLTSTIYEQIKALQDQGRASDAAALAQKAYADAFDTTSKNLEQNLGIVEKGWRGITSVAKGAWDAMLGVGRKRTLSDQLADVTAEIAKGQKPFDPSVGGNAEARARLQSNLALQASLQELIRLEQRQGAAVAANNEQNAARIAWLKEGDKYISKAVQMEREIAKARNEGAAAGASQVEIEKRIADIRDKYKEKSTAVANTEVANLKARIAGEQQYLAQLKLHGAAADKLNQGEKDALKYSEMLKGSLDAKTRARTQELLVQSQISAGILREIDVTKELIKAQADFIVLRDRENVTIANEIIKLNEKAQAVEDEIAMYGLGKEAIDSLAIARLEEKRAVLLQFEGSEERVAQLEQEIDARKRLSRAIDAKETLEANAKAARRLSDQWKRDFDRIEDWIGDAIGRGVTKGKDIWKSLIDGLKASFARLVLSPIISPIAAFGASMLNPTAAQAAGSAGSAFGSASNIFSAGKTLYEGFSTGFSSLSGTVSQAVQSGMNAVSGSGGFIGQGPMQTSPFAQGVGSAAGSLMGAAGGFYGGRLISNGYSAFGGSGNTAVNAGMVAGAGANLLLTGTLLGPLGLLLGGLAGGAVNRLFGMRPKEYTTAGIQGNFNQEGFTDAKNFQRWEQKGGVFRKDKDGTDYSDLDAAYTKALGDSFKAIKASTQDFAKSLGLDAAAIQGYAKGLVIELTGDQAKDAEILAKTFGDLGDEMATTLLPNFKEFQKVGETASTTLQRLAVVNQTVDGMYGAIGVDAVAAFGAVGVAAAGAKQKLVDAAGGIDAYVAKSNFFASNFLLPEEQLKPVSDQVAAVFKKYSIAGDVSKEQFAGIVKQSMLDTSDAGIAMTNALKDIAPAVLTLINFSDTLTEKAKALGNTARDLDIEFLEAQGNGYAATLARRAAALSDADPSLRGQMQRNYDAADNDIAFNKTIEYMRLIGDATGALNAERERELATLPPAARAVQKLINAYEDAISAVDNAMGVLQRSIDAEKTAVTSAYNGVMESLGKQIESVTGSVGKLSSLSSALRSTVNSMRLDSQLEIDRASASAQIQTALAIAKAGGVLPDADKLQNALSVIAQPNEQLYATFAEFQYAYLKDKNAIAELADITDGAKSVQDKMLDSLNEQRKAAEQGYKDEIQRLDDIITNAQDQISALNGIDTSVKAVEIAIAALNGSIAGALAQRPATSTPTSGGSSGTSSIVSDLYATYAGKTGSQIDAEGAAYWAARVASGESAESIAKSFQDSVKAVRGYWTGGDHMGGLRIVGERGPELEATGPSRIFSASQTAQILRGGSDSSAMMAEIRELSAENKQLREDIKELLEKVVESSEKTAELIENVTDGGNAMRTEELT